MMTDMTAKTREKENSASERTAKWENTKVGYPGMGFPETKLNPIAIFHTEDENNPNGDTCTESQIAMHECMCAGMR